MVDGYYQIYFSKFDLPFTFSLNGNNDIKMLNMIAKRLYSNPRKKMKED